MKKISILDYELGNSGSISNMLNYLNIPNNVIRTSNELKDVQFLIIPGVGSYDEGIRNLKRNDLFNALNELALEKKIPILGICLGMQLMLEKSDEGELEGLGWIKGEVNELQKFSNEKKTHMGWNYVTYQDNYDFKFNNFQRYYFVHSYFANKIGIQNTLCKANYGNLNFVSGIIKDNIIGVQYHPEKSHSFGMEFFKKWVKRYKANDNL